MYPLEEKNATPWAMADQLWAKLPLIAKKGDINTPEDDYGGLISHLNFSESKHGAAGSKVGVCFKGTAACDKCTHNREYIPKSSREFMPIMYLLLHSMAMTKFGAYNSRFSALYGAKTAYHTDDNTRGSHPNASRFLDPGMSCRLPCCARCSRPLHCRVQVFGSLYHQWG